MDPEQVERNRTVRVEKNLIKKREEKGLITVMESLNESDANKSLAPNLSQFGPNKTKMGAQNMAATDAIAEENYNGDDSECNEGSYYS